MNKLGLLPHADLLFGVATRAAEKAADQSDDVLVAILFSAASVEAYSNDLVEHVALQDSQTAIPAVTPEIAALKSVAREIAGRAAHLRMRVQIIRALLTGAPYQPGEQPYSDFDLLVALRNAVVHIQPESVMDHPDHGLVTKPSEVLRRLAGRQLVSPQGETTLTPWLTEIRTVTVAKWAVQTSKAMLLSLEESFPEGPWRKKMSAFIK